MSDDLSPPVGFSGTVRLFPLPDLVLFPQAMQPLHIFEPRYRQLTADALASDRFITMVLLRPGWEEIYKGDPPIHPVACVGRIVAEQRLHDGRYHLLLRGLRRVRILHELERPTLYRVAQAELLTDTPAPAAVAAPLLQQLAEQAAVWVPAQTPAAEQFRKLFQANLDLGALSDVLSSALPLELEIKQALLAELNVERRVRCLLQHLEKSSPAKEKQDKSNRFPPEFSSN
jgi:Lon protease-like protein